MRAWRTPQNLTLYFVDLPLHICSKLCAGGAERKDLGVQRCMVHRYSLRAYVAILYRCWPEGLAISLRSLPVQPQDIRCVCPPPLLVSGAGFGRVPQGFHATCCPGWLQE